MSEYKAQLLAVEAKLAKDPSNEELLSLKADLIELIELSCGLEEEEGVTGQDGANKIQDLGNEPFDPMIEDSNAKASSSKASNSRRVTGATNNLVDKNSKRVPSESELLARKKEKNRKKKAKLRERVKEQLDVAESVKQSWQSFANKKGLKGVTKKSIFASPCSVTGKVGVGTNGIADAPSAAVTTLVKRKY
mgnify:CR=1 FL=1